MREIISYRTKIALAVLKSQGIKLGRPLKSDIPLIIEYRNMGLSLSQISQETKLHRSTISKLLKRYCPADKKGNIK